ncbi:MAG: transposase [Acidobacteriaceae bacterium]
MPPRLKRMYESPGLHFITFSCYHREANLSSTPLKDLFLATLEWVRQEYRFAITGYVVMPEHVHLLLGKPEKADISVVIQVLKQIVSRRASLEHFWQRRFYDFNVQTEAKRKEKLRYIHRNPVERGLVEKPDDWRWSGFRFYLTGEPSCVTVDSSWLDVWRPSADPTLREKREGRGTQQFVDVRSLENGRLDKR